MLGWEGTLAPEGDGWELEPEVVGPWMAEARRFVSGTMGGVLCFEELMGALRRRLMGVYAMGVAAGWDGLTAEQRRGVERVAGLVVEDWEAGVELFARRLRAGRAELAGWMGVARLPEVISMSAAGSDVHGRAGVGIEIGFAGGARVFYKPRAVTGEVLWAELQGRLAEVDPGAGVRVARTLAGEDEAGEFGWMEGLAPGGCEEGVYWRRAGALLCGAVATGLSDLHMANVVSTVDGPAVVDAECLGGCAVTTEGLEGELLGTGLLPFGEDGDLPDVSGLFGRGTPVSGVLVPRWSGGTAVEFVGARLLEQRNWAGGERAALACLPEMVEGFRCAAEAMRRIGPELLDGGGWVSRLEMEHAPRVLRRSTLQYGSVMGRSLQPEVVGSEEARARAVREGLRELGGAVEEAEVRGLLRLWVPRFTRVAQGRSSNGGVQGRMARMCGEGMESGVAEALAGILFRAPQVAGSG